MKRNTLNGKMKIGRRDLSSHCDFASSDFVIYSKERAEWLEEAAEEYFDIQGDDGWLDWVSEGERLTQKGE